MPEPFSRREQYARFLVKFQPKLVFRFLALFREEFGEVDPDNYQVLLYNPNKAHPKVYYGIYYGWDDSGRLRAGREVFIPCSKEDSFIKLLPQNHTKGSDTYNKLCQDYQIDDFFDNYRFSQMPKMPNWLAKQEDELKGREPIPSFLEGHYYSYHLSPAKTDHVPYNKPIARDLLTIEPNGEVVLAIKDNQTLRGKAFKIDRFLYLSVKANDRHRFSIYLINTLKQYNDVIIGLNLEVNEQVETIVSSREILFRRTADAEDTADLLPIDQELIGRLNKMQPGASEYLTGPTDNYIRLPRVPVSKGKKLAKHFDYGKVYFYAACYCALAEEDMTAVNKLLAEAFRHGFDDLGRLAHEKAQGTLRPFDKSLLIPKDILQKLTELDRAKEDASYSLSPSAKVWQIPFRGKYNPEFIQKIFELYSQTKHELHIIGEVAQHISGHNTELVEQLEGTLRRLLEKDPDITVHRYQTAVPVNEFWLKRLIALKQDFGGRFKLFGKKEESDLSNINIILIDPFYEQNTNIIIFTRDNTPTDDIPVPIFAVVEQNYKHLSDGLRSKVNKITRSFQALENEHEIRNVLG